jgi:purine-binding chemotaxis protein CheW
MADPAATPADSAATRRFLTFRMDRRLYAAPAEDVAEVIRVPAVARVPQGPASLLGIANLRGAVLPVASLRGLLGAAEAPASAASRAIVLQGGAPVALAVDSVGALVSVEAGDIETRRAELAEAPGERLLGVFQPQGGGDVARVLDIRALLNAAFVQRPRAPRRTTAGPALQQGETALDTGEKLVTFEIAGQEYGLDLAVVREIVPAPDTLAVSPDAEAAVLGVMAYRDGLLPLMSLRALLGFGPGAAGNGRSKVVVTSVGGVLVGLVADRMRAIVPADPRFMEPTPPMLAARTGGESRIKAIYRGEGGRRLISVLAPEQLFREDVMQRLGGGREAARAQAGDTAAAEAAELRFLVFRLGDEEFGLPIDAVDEVARVPDLITRLPKTPKFLEGVVNLRGEVLPVVDQRRRFGMAESTDRENRRLIVVRTERHRAGLIVDAVSEVLRTAADAIEPAPDLAGEATRLVNGVLNLEAVGRIVLLLDPAELLTRAERGLLDALDPEAEQGRA